MKKHKTWTNRNFLKKVNQEDRDKRTAWRWRKITEASTKEQKKKWEKKEILWDIDGVSHPVFGKQQIDSGISNDVHTELKGLDLPWLSSLCNLCHFHGLKVSRQEKLPQTVPEKEGSSCKDKIIFKAKKIFNQNSSKSWVFLSKALKS